MRVYRAIPRGVALSGAVVVALGLAGCAPKVTREEFNTEVTKLREEMQAGDQALATRLETRLDALEKDLQAFRNEYNVSMERMETALKFSAPVHFEFDSAELREADRPLLDRFANVVKEHYPDAVITVEGFADPVGTARYNQRLGKRRADAVAGYLVASGGLTTERLRTVSYGEARERQVVPGAGGPSEGLENRRVALVVDFNGAAQAQEQPVAAR